MILFLYCTALRSYESRMTSGFMLNPLMFIVASIAVSAKGNYKVNGVQLGLVNCTNEVNGLQGGIANAVCNNQPCTPLQLGVFNYIHYPKPRKSFLLNFPSLQKGEESK